MMPNLGCNMGRHTRRVINEVHVIKCFTLPKAHDVPNVIKILIDINVKAIPNMDLGWVRVPTILSNELMVGLICDRPKVGMRMV